MTDQPLVTISIPTYNLGNYLEKTLNSVFKQTSSIVKSSATLRIYS